MRSLRLLLYIRTTEQTSNFKNNNHINIMIKKQFVTEYSAPDIRLLALESQLPLAQSPTGGITVEDLTETDTNWD